LTCNAGYKVGDKAGAKYCYTQNAACSYDTATDLATQDATINGDGKCGSGDTCTGATYLDA